MAKTGRPSNYTDKIALEICSRIMKGQSVREISRSDDMPAMSTIFNWLNVNEEFVEQYTRAKQAQIEHYAEEIIEISDDSTNDYIERQRADETKYEDLNSEHIQRSKLRIESRKWLMGKLKPKKYGEKTQLTGADGESPAQIEHITRTIVDPKS